jgi:5-methyltetrahydrofolate--homocysteine methyltransferase
VFYCKDAFEGLETMDKLSDPQVRPGFVHQAKAEAAGVLHEKQRGRVALAELGKASQNGERVRSNVRRDVPVPAPPFWGTQVVTRIKLQDVVDCLDRNALYRLQWGAKNAKGAEWDKLRSEFDTRVRDLIREAERDGWLEPKVIYGYFPVQSDGNELIVYDPASLVETGTGGWGPEAGRGPLPRPLSKVRDLTRFVFPRQPERERLSLADYFRAADEGEFDVAAFQIVTMGTRVDDLTEELQASGDYSRSYFIHGLSVSLAEALAEYTNRVVRQGLGLRGEQGKRYSWGYPACPDLDEHAKLFGILPAEKIGVTLTDAFQLVPEQSTAAIVVHHPEAKYFSIGSARERAEGDVEAVAA